MGVNICICNKPTENYVKDSSIDCYKKSDPSYYPNVITANNLKSNTINNNIEEKEKYKKVFKENRRISKSMKSNDIKPVVSTSYSNNNNINEEKYLENIIKIQNCFRKFNERKNYIKKRNSENEKDKDKNKDKNKDNSISLRINLEIAETNFSSNSFRNLHVIQNQINTNNKYESNACGIICPFNIKNKLKNNYKYSGYLKKNKKYKSIISLKNNSDNSSSSEKKEINDNEEKSELVRQGFGKFIFNDGSEFCGIFNDNYLQAYGKYSNINHNKDKYNEPKNDKEIIITDNLNYEEFIGEYRDYVSDGFGIYKNFITNLRVTGFFNGKGISGIGIEDSVEGGYVYTGEFQNNKKEGVGTIIWKDGNKYQGEFKDNQLNGYGIIEYPGKKYYQGEVKNGRMDGFGEFFWKEEKRYIGNYKNDKRNGFGVFIFKLNNNYKNPMSLYENENNNANNISAYIGFWKNGNMDGFGMKINNLEIKYGLWENGMKRKYLESSFALKTYIKWIDKKYNKLFLGQQTDIINFMEKCLNIDKDIYPANQENQIEK